MPLPASPVNTETAIARFRPTCSPLQCLVSKDSIIQTHELREDVRPANVRIKARMAALRFSLQEKRKQSLAGNPAAVFEAGLHKLKKPLQVTFECKRRSMRYLINQLLRSSGAVTDKGTSQRCGASSSSGNGALL